MQSANAKKTDAGAARDPKQLQSWFDRFGSREFPGLVAQVFFPTAHASLDAQDRSVLDELVRHYEQVIDHSSVWLRFEGHADPRGTDESNLDLGLRRARAVGEFVDFRLFQKVNRPSLRRMSYTSKSLTFGERGALGRPLAGDRRVDVFSSYVSKRPPIQLEGSTITGDYRGKLSNRFRFRTLIGASVTLGPIGAQVFSFEIQNARTGRTWTFTYTGAGGGIGFSVNRPSGWDEKTLPEGLWMDVDAFEGSGRAYSAGAGAGGLALSFDGPMERRLTNRPLVLGFSGWDVVLGFEVDKFGYFHHR